MFAALTHPVAAVLVIGGLTISYLIIRKMFGHDAREPPLAPQSIPFIGHMLGLSRSKFNYYVDLRYVLLHVKLNPAPRPQLRLPLNL